MNQIIKNKIAELITLSEKYKENDVQIVMTALSGAIAGGDETMLAINTQEFIKKVLMPNAMQQIANRNASQN